MEQVCVRLVFLCRKGVREGKRWNDVGFDMPERDIVAYRKSAEARPRSHHSPSLSLSTGIFASRFNDIACSKLLKPIQTEPCSSHGEIINVCRQGSQHTPNNLQRRRSAVSNTEWHFSFWGSRLRSFTSETVFGKERSFFYLITEIDRKLFADCQESACYTPGSTTQEKCRWVRSISLIMHGNSVAMGMLVHECRK
jgi:hypothetical protein